MANQTTTDALAEALRYVREIRGLVLSHMSYDAIMCMVKDTEERLESALAQHDAAKKEPAPAKQSEGAALIAAERARHVSQEGWTPKHDDEHTNYELSSAACCYAQPGRNGPYSHPNPGFAPPGWPWDEEWWKPSEDAVRNLVKAGALIAAEIDRLQRAARAAQGEKGGL